MKSAKKIILGLIGLFVLVSLSQNIFAYKKSLQFYDSYKIEYEKELKKNTELKTQILKNSDPYEIEHVMRDKLNLSQEGETVILLTLPTPTPFIPTPTPKPVYEQWFDVFFRR